MVKSAALSSERYLALSMSYINGHYLTDQGSYDYRYNHDLLNPATIGNWLWEKETRRVIGGIERTARNPTIAINVEIVGKQEIHAAMIKAEGLEIDPRHPKLKDMIQLLGTGDPSNLQVCNGTV